ncbi:MAG: type II secretion system F family protein [Candidatus Omnitrophica bacterium]|nr:type II secretion system F family protein [Candidatus Omnitrophota bacterium]
MGLYRYKAKKGPDKVITSVIAAGSKEEAVDKISKMGYLPVLVEVSGSSSNDNFKQQGFFAGRIKQKQITVFARQLSILLKSGVPILKALIILTNQTPNQKLKRILNSVRVQIKDGKTLSSALAFHSEVFSVLFVSLIAAGEESGTMEVALLRIAEYRKKKEQIFSDIRTALTYPILMALVGTGTIIFMLTFVMPRLLSIFTRLGQELPLPTKILISISNFLTQQWVWPVFVLGIAVIFILIKRMMATKAGKLIASHIKLRSPIFGALFLKAELAQFSRTLDLLLKSGIQLLSAIQKSIATLDNEVIKQELKKGYKSIEQGETFGATLDKCSLFPKFMVNLVSVGEESGKIEGALEELAITYEEETDEAIKIMTNLLEPLMILFMGVIVGFIIVSMLLPVFQLNLIVQ